MKSIPLMARLLCCALAFGAAAGSQASVGREVLSGSVTGRIYEPGATVAFQGWAPSDLANGQGAVYFFLEWPVTSLRDTVQDLMARGTIPPGLCVSLEAGTLKAPKHGTDRGRRPGELDQPGPEYPSFLLEEVLPAAERLLGVKASRSSDLHFIAGASSGGFAAFNACWYRNDGFRRAYCNSPTFSNIRGGNHLLPLVRKSEGRPIRVYVTAGTDEPDYYFGDSYLAAEDAVSALRYAGYELRYDRFAHQGHGAAWGDAKHLAKVLTWLFEDWRTKPVAAPAPSMRVRKTVFATAGWTPCEFAMPTPVCETRSSDQWLEYSVNPTNRFVMARARAGEGVRTTDASASAQTLAPAVRHAPLELAWNASRVGGAALALAADDRLWVATELGVQGVVSFGIADVVLPLPGDLPCNNVALVGTNLYASSGRRVFRRPVKVGAPVASCKSPATPGYDDGFWYTREHEPAGGVGELLGSYVTAGRVAGVVSVLSDADYHETYDCAGWADYGGRDIGKMTPDTLFAVFSMTKTFTGAAIMCAIDEGRLALDDEVAKYLTEFADVKMKDGSKPSRPLTVRDLMSHVTGFRAGGGCVDRNVPLREIARKLASEPLHAQPGETFWYGNAWVDSAAACLEIAVGEPYEKYLQRKVLDPLGMKDTTFWPTEAQLKRLVKAYTSDDGGIRPGRDRCTDQLLFPKKGKVFPAASGGLFSTPRDMIRFSQMLAHHGTWKGKAVISRKTFDGIFAVKQTPSGVTNPYTCGSWLYGDWFGHEGAMRTDQRANLKTGHSRVFFIQTENAAGPAFFQLKRDWHAACDFVQGTPPTVFGN